MTTKRCLGKQRILLENYVSLGLAERDSVSVSESSSKCTGLSVQSEVGSGTESRGTPSEINYTACLHLSTSSFWG